MLAIYEMAADRIEAVRSTSFEVERLRERADLQRLLRDHVEVVASDAMVLTEEFGDWEESRRRIDLLCLVKDANILVVELKRTDDGGHMELQAVRYAAMVSAMTFDQVVATHETYLSKRGIERSSREAILHFLGWEEPHEPELAKTSASSSSPRGSRRS
jgi:RecB family endonuclease NucS